MTNQTLALAAVSRSSVALENNTSNSNSIIGKNGWAAGSVGNTAVYEDNDWTTNTAEVFDKNSHPLPGCNHIHQIVRKNHAFLLAQIGSSNVASNGNVAGSVSKIVMKGVGDAEANGTYSQKHSLNIGLPHYCDKSLPVFSRIGVCDGQMAHFSIFNPNTAVFGTFVFNLFLSKQQAVMIKFSTLHMAQMNKNLGLSHCPGEVAGESIPTLELSQRSDSDGKKWPLCNWILFVNREAMGVWPKSEA